MQQFLKEKKKELSKRLNDAQLYSESWWHIKEMMNLIRELEELN
jgi:hypothetical protein